MDMKLIKNTFIFIILAACVNAYSVTLILHAELDNNAFPNFSYIGNVTAGVSDGYTQTGNTLNHTEYRHITINNNATRITIVGNAQQVMGAFPYRPDYNRS
jgi:hypothetical protein